MCVSCAIYCIFGHVLAIFNGFLLTPFDDLDTIPPFYVMHISSPSDTECLVNISSCKSKPFWSYNNFFFGFSGSRGLIGAWGKRKQSFILKGLACKISIKIGAMIHFKMLYPMMEGKIKFWILAWLQAPISFLLILFVITTVSIKPHPPNLTLL